MKFSFEAITDLKYLLRELSVGLLKLSFEDNFNSTIHKDIIIKSGEIKRIRHRLGVVPTGYLVIKQQGVGIVTTPQGKDRAWDKDMIHLQNILVEEYEDDDELDDGSGNPDPNTINLGDENITVTIIVFK